MASESTPDKLPATAVGRGSTAATTQFNNVHFTFYCRGKEKKLRVRGVNRSGAGLIGRTQSR